MPLIIAFGIGVALQAVLLMRGDWDWLKLLGCVLIAGCLVFPGSYQRGFQLVNVLFFFSMFAFAFALLFYNDILQFLNVPIVLSYTLVFWFAFFANFYDGSPRHVELALLALVPSVFSFVIALRTGPFSFVPKLVLYSWFLIMILCLGLMQFPFSQLQIFFEDKQVPWVSPVESFMAGMAFLFLLVNACYVYWLVPVPGRSQSWADRMKEWHAFTDELTRRVDDSPLGRARIATVLVAEGVLLMLNYHFAWLSPALAINMAIVIPSMLLNVRTEPASAASAEK